MAKRWFLALVFVWLCLATIPTFPAAPGLGIDASWIYGLNLAHAQGLIFGPQIAFTFGPLAYLGVPDPTIAEPTAVIAFDLLIYVPLVYSIYLLCKQLKAPLISAAIIFIIVIDLQFKWDLAENLQVTFLCVVWFLIVPCSFLDTAAFVVAGVLAGISMLVKTNDAVSDLILFYIVWSFAVFKARRLSSRGLVIAAIPAVTFVCIFVVMQRSPNAIWSYLRNSLSAIDGYSEAMSSIGPTWEVWLGMASIGLIFLIALLWTRTELSSRTLVAAIPLTLISFKHAIVRQDAHVITLHSDLAVVCIFFILGAQTTFRRSVFILIAFLNIACGFLIAGHELPGIDTRIIHVLEMRGVANLTSAYLHLDANWQHAREATEAALLPKKVDPELAREIGNSSVHDLSWNIDLIRANHFRWNPLPVFQSYAAYTPVLDLLNSEHVRSSGPDFLFATWEDIDKRHPFLDTAATWRSVLDQYELANGNADLFLLRKRPGHRLSSPTPLGQPLTLHWNEVAYLPEIPNDQILIMRVISKLSFWGTIRHALFRTDPTFVEATYKSGAKVAFRMTRANLINGAIVSDLPRSLTELLPMLGYATHNQRDRVVSLRFVASDTAEFDHSIVVSWSAARIIDLKAGPAPLAHPDTRSLVSLWKPGDAIEMLGMNVSSGTNELIMRPTNLDPQLLLKADQDLRRFKTLIIRVKFSVADQMNVFFGMQINGRGFAAYSSPTNQWLDVYVNTAANPYWATEAGKIIRFDPSTNLSLNSHTEIAGLWGAEQQFLPNSSQVKMFLSAASPISLEGVSK